MPEYVYALHDFTPENPDEVAFKVGDRIEVIEKDDLYQDGWWQGRNPAGQSGLFPQSYTSPNPPSSSIAFPDAASTSPKPPASQEENGTSALHTLQEEPESGTANEEAARHSPTDSERQRKPSNGDVMMRATMTDVQKAIEQLGRSDRDGARSFSFASSHGDYSERSETETEDDHDADAEDETMGWHKDARAKLAERAQRENEQRQAREAEEQSRAMIPPIDVEVSDESDMEDEDSPRSPRKPHQYPRIAEEDEEAEEEEKSQDAVPLTPHGPASAISDESIIPSTRYVVPDETDLPTATASTFPEPSPPPTAPLVSSPTTENAPESETTPEPEPAEAQRAPTPSSPPVQHAEDVRSVTPIITPAPSTMKVAEQLPFSTASALPSPTASSAGSFVPSSAGIQQTLTPATTVASFKTSASTPHASGSGVSEATKKSGTHPSEWSVEEVVEWLKSKGFDQGVCDLFTEQEITGDVLLELDANILKSEIGIVAFGKRVRIVNAISELRRPPSVTESEPHLAPALTPRSLSHSFHYPGSHHSQPSHSHSQSIQSSAHQSFMNSPMYAPPSPSVANGLGSAGLASMTGPESPLPGEMSPIARNGWRASDPGSINGSAINLDEDARGRTVVGLGLGLPPTSPQAKGTKGRPSQLVLSPSDSALGDKVSAVQDRTSGSIKDERAVMSETESVRTKEPKAKRRLFGRDSGSLKEKPASLKDSASQHSGGGTPAVSPDALGSPTKAEQQPVRRRSKGSGSIDERKPDRLSLFGASFHGTLGKHRKPPPRLSNVGEKAEGDKPHLSTFAKFREKRSNGRPGTSDGTVSVKKKDELELKPKEAEKEAETEKEQDKEPVKEKEKTKPKDKRDRTTSLSPSKERDPQVLRKRTSSAAEVPTRSALASSKTAGAPSLKAGQSILEQIGTPDHNGWLRKKGDRYNSWKQRYFVLKGPHLYWLRSESKAETKIKGYLNIVGYKVLADENVDPGRYGFRIVHDQEKSHYFSSDEQLVVREWMKALMKATISRDYSNPVMSSCNIPTIPLTVAQAMNPAPRPPSPTARDATQKALRRTNPEQLSTRDAQVLLLGMPSKENGASSPERTRLESFFTNDAEGSDLSAPKTVPTPKSPVPPRPSRELRRMSTSQGPSDYDGPVDSDLIEWANTHLPSQLQIKDASGSLCGGLALLRLAEDIRGKPSSPPVPDSAFPTGPNDDKLDGLFRLFDYLLDNDVKMGTVSINDIRQGRRDKIVQLLRALRTWEEKRKTIAQSIGKGSVSAGPFMGMAGPSAYYNK